MACALPICVYDFSWTSCQQLIDSSYDFQGDCCSFQDVGEGCEIHVVGECSFQRLTSPECSTFSDALTTDGLRVGCVSSETVLFQMSFDDSLPPETCPPSNYNPYANRLTFLDNDPPETTTDAPGVTPPANDGDGEEGTPTIMGDDGEDDDDDEPPADDDEDDGAYISTTSFSLRLFSGLFSFLMLKSM